MNVDRTAAGRALLYVGVVMLAVSYAIPYFWLLQMSLKTEADAFEMPPRLLFMPTFENFASLIAEAKFTRAFLNSVITAGSAMVVAPLLGVPAAYALSRASFRAERPIALWVLTTRMAPPIAFGIPFFLAFRYLGLIDSLLGLGIIYLTFNLSLVIWMMRIFFDGLPRSLEEAAWIDGATLWQAFTRITLPLSAPGLATTAIFCFLFSWNDFFYALILTRSGATTAPVAVTNFIKLSSWDWGMITASATTIVLPVVAFSILVRKYLISGLTAGSVKG